MSYILYIYIYIYIYICACVHLYKHCKVNVHITQTKLSSLFSEVTKVIEELRSRKS